MKHAIPAAIAALITSAIAHAEAVLVTHAAVYAVPSKSPLFPGTVTQGELQELRFVEIKVEQSSDGSPFYQAASVEGPVQNYTLIDQREKDQCLPNAQVMARLHGEMPKGHAMIALPRGAKPRELTVEDRKHLHPKLCASNAVGYAVGYAVGADQIAICAGANAKLIVAKRRGKAPYRVEETFAVECR